MKVKIKEFQEKTVTEVVGMLEEDSDQLKEIRGSLVVSFGNPDREPYILKDIDGKTTFQLMVQVFDYLKVSSKSATQE